MVLRLLLASLVALPPLVRGQCESYIIVGAGMSGLSAAKRLVDRGISGANIKVFEARSRTGGRVYTDTTSLGSGVKVDMGASWIHGGGTGNPIRGLADSYSVSTARDPDEVAVRFRSSGTIYTDSEVTTASGRIEGLGQEASDEVGEDSSISMRSVASRLQAGPNLELLRARTEFDTAAPDSQISPYRALNAGSDFSGPELIFAEGYSQIPDGLTNRLRTAGVVFHFDSPVTAVSYQNSKCGGVTVTVNGTTHDAGAAVVTVPLGVLKAGSLQFSPALPDNMQQAINRLQMGKNGKAFARFASDFWSSEIGANSFVFAVDIPSVTDGIRGRHFQFFNLKKHISQPVLMSFMSGDYAAAADSKTDDEVKADFMQTLRIAFPNAPDPTHFVPSTWGSDQYSLGSYSVWAGTSYQASDYSTLSAAVTPALALAGEHTEPSYFSSVHGAYLSGEHAANQVYEGVVTASSASGSQRGLTRTLLGSLFLALAASQVFV